MAFDLSRTLVIGISSTALFDMSESDGLFRKLMAEDRQHAIQRYREYMLAHENEHLEPGTGYPLVSALLGLNRFGTHDDPVPLVEVVIMSRNSPETGFQVLNTIRNDRLAITRSAFTGGEPVSGYIRAFDVDLFLTTNIEDAQSVIDSGSCAVAILRDPPETVRTVSKEQVRLAFDGDAVLFSEESELVYKTQGLDAFQKMEDEKQDIPLAEGPYATFLKKLAALQEKLNKSGNGSSIRIALVTSRNSPSEMRVIKTLRSWGVHIDEAFFLGGVDKTSVLTAFNPHIFFDDQDIHLEKAEQLVPSRKVPYSSRSPFSGNRHTVLEPMWRQADSPVVQEKHNKPKEPVASQGS